MSHDKQDPQAETPAAAADAETTPVERLEALGVRGILTQLARDGQIIDVRCEMPQCYCFRGRSYFEPRSARSVKAGRKRTDLRRSYVTCVRQLRLLGLRPHCEACRTGGHGMTVELAHEPGEEIQLDWLELSETPWGEPAYVLVGALSFSAAAAA